MSYDLTQPIGLAATEDTDVERPPAQVQQFIEQLRCPECGQMCKGSTGLGVHRSTKHGYKGPKQLRKPRKVTKPKMLPVPKPVQEDPPWTADEIFTSVVSMLYPAGSIPVQALTVLMQWHADTERMLKGLS